MSRAFVPDEGRVRRLAARMVDLPIDADRVVELTERLRAASGSPAVQLAAVRSLVIDRRHVRVADMRRLAEALTIVDGDDWVHVPPTGEAAGNEFSTQIDGVSHGPAWSLDHDCRVWRYGVYEHGVRHGAWVTGAGASTREDTYDRGHLVRTRLFQGGAPLLVMSRNEAGKPVGTMRRWYVGGGVMWEREYGEDGRRAGEERWFWRDGARRRLSKVVDGRSHGPTRRWYPDGTPRMLGRFDCGAKAGMWRWYYPTGNIWLEVPYEEGRVHGDVRLWDDGDCVVEGECDRGRPVSTALLQAARLVVTAACPTDSTSTVPRP